MIGHTLLLVHFDMPFNWRKNYSAFRGSSFALDTSLLVDRTFIANPTCIQQISHY